MVGNEGLEVQRCEGEPEVDGVGGSPAAVAVNPVGKFAGCHPVQCSTYVQQRHPSSLPVVLTHMACQHSVQAPFRIYLKTQELGLNLSSRPYLSGEDATKVDSRVVAQSACEMDKFERERLKKRSGIVWRFPVMSWFAGRSAGDDFLFRYIVSTATHPPSKRQRDCLVGEKP